MLGAVRSAGVIPPVSGQRRSRGRGLPEAPGSVLALPGGAAAELGTAAGGGLARGDGDRGRAAAPRGSRVQGCGTAGRRLPEASARAGGSDPQGERQRHPVRNGTNALRLPANQSAANPNSARSRFRPTGCLPHEHRCKPVLIRGKQHPIKASYMF